MTASFRTLMTGVIDYAGMYPPAELPMDAAIRNYARFRSEPESWMLGRFICPAARLTELSPYVAELFREGPPLTIIALGRGGANEATFLAGVTADLQEIATFRTQHHDRVTVDVFETKLPFPSASIVTEARDLLDADGRDDLTVFYEQANVGALRDIGRYDRGAGHKVRCGGVTAEAIPSAGQLAEVIAAARNWGVRLKFTAGLHHPIRRLDAGLQTKTHGFLNVFVAGAIASARQLERDAVLPIIEEEDPASFTFEDGRLQWRDLRASAADVKSARLAAVTSFGSCSFDEPRDELRALGLL